VKLGEPTLYNHGMLKEMRNINAAMSDPIKITGTFKNGQRVEMTINLTEPRQLKINTYENDKSLFPLMSYVSADRWGPRVFMPLYNSTEDLTHVGECGEYVIDYLSRHERDIVPQLLCHPNTEGYTLLYNVRAWLKEIAPYVTFKHSTYVKRDIAYAEINDFRPTNTGFGLSYTLPVIVSLLGMAAEWEDKERQSLKESNGVIVLLENPEAHLHPKAQTAIGRLIALTAVSGVQVIVETHSEHIMDGIRIAVKDKELSPDMAKFHYFSLDKDGNTIVETPKIYPNGKLDFWPKGFFDQAMLNSARLAKR
ncbi:AAA family ATPase, partial [Candidatus Magnetobacterium casense]